MHSYAIAAYKYAATLRCSGKGLQRRPHLLAARCCEVGDAERLCSGVCEGWWRWNWAAAAGSVASQCERPSPEKEYEQAHWPLEARSTASIVQAVAHPSERVSIPFKWLSVEVRGWEQRCPDAGLR